MIKSSPGEGQINHYIGVRLELNGVGKLRMKLLSADEVKTSTLLPVQMKLRTNIEPFRKANFKQQTAQLEVRTSGFGESFEISKIVFFTKPSAANYPG